MADLSNIVEEARGRHRLLFLDYDGTLVPFAEKPHLACPDSELLELLERLTARADTTVHIVTGRSRDSIEEWLGHLPVGLHAEHGYWTRPRRDAEWSSRFPGRERDWLDVARALIASSVTAVPGSFIEEKRTGLAWHYRLASAALAASALELLRLRLQDLCARHGLHLLDGDCVLELREIGVHKGHVVSEVVREHAPESFVVAIGDDVTDDDMFRALPAGGYAIAAGARPASAHVRVEGHDHVRAFLRRLCAVPSSALLLHERPAASATD